jgi:signal transduction histidine kinase/CHASE3 domain sensor protein
MGPSASKPAIAVNIVAKHWKIRSIAGIAVVAAILVVAGNAWLAVRSIEQLNQSQAWVSHTWQVLNKIDQITGSLKDAESSTRGYIITSDEEYLAPLRKAQQDLPSELTQLQQLTDDNPYQKQRVQQLGDIIRRRMAILERGAQLHQEHSSEDARTLVRGGSGQAVMGSIRAIAAGMQRDEKALLDQRVANWKKSAVRAKEAALFASTLDLTLLLLTFRFVSREQKLRARADATNDRLERLQLISDAALTKLSLADLTNEMLDRVRKVLDADSAVLCMLRDGELHVDRARGISIPPGRVIQYRPGGPIHRAAYDGKAVVIDKTIESSVPIEELRREMTGLLIMPLTAGEKAIGVLIAGRRTARPFNDQDVDLLSLVADRIALSLDRADAYEAERSARKLAETHAGEVRNLNTELEARVRLRTSELEIANKELEAFSYSVSHDLRAPLRTVDGFSLALEEDFGAALDDTARNYLQRIRASVQHMGNLIDALLQLSRITRADLNRQAVDLSAMGSEIIQEIQQLDPSRKFQVSIQPGLRTVADPRLLRVALENLLGNAVKFTARTPDAKIFLGQQPGSNAFFIRDNGAGFDMRYADKLFTAFQRLHGDREFRGSGIGLATVARVIHRHHGQIHAEGDVGKGATFWFTLNEPEAKTSLPDVGAHDRQK